MNKGQVGTTRGDVYLPHTAGSVGNRSGTIRTSRGSSGVFQQAAKEAIGIVQAFSNRVIGIKHYDDGQKLQNQQLARRVYSRSQDQVTGNPDQVDKLFAATIDSTSSSSSAPASRNDGGGSRQSAFGQITLIIIYQNNRMDIQ